MKADRVRDALLTLRFDVQRTFGLPGLLGALLFAAVVAVGVTTSRVHADSKSLADSVRLTRVPSKQHRVIDEHTAAVDAIALDALPDLFPGFTQSANDIASILAQARESNLTLGTAEYQVMTESGARFTRYRVMLPVKDQYSTIRHFLAAVLNNVPNAALQEIHVERPAVDGNILDARVRFELVYRTAQP